MDDDALLGPAEAAAFLRWSRSTLEQWRAKSLGPRWVRIGDRGVAYRASDLKQFINEASGTPVSAAK
jgi:predicted DNA-binding transcriptional regulator AlpA